jgi:hypothetical protein
VANPVIVANLGGGDQEDHSWRPALAKSWQDLMSPIKSWVLVQPVTPASYVEGINRKIMVQAGPGREVRPHSKRAGVMAQGIESLPSKLLSSNPSTAKKTF